MSVDLQHQLISHAEFAVVENARHAINGLARHPQAQLNLVILDRNRKLRGEDNPSFLGVRRSACG